MRKVIFITGSVRSGKSDFAVKLAKGFKQKIVFIATCPPLDEEMKCRIKKHRRKRPQDWRTIEEEVHLPAVLDKLRKEEAAIVDCITLWISNLLLSGRKEDEVLREVEELVESLKKIQASVVLVSNEVGWGIVPDNKLSRIFRDIVGITHQKISKVSDEVYLMVGGIPLRLK